MLEVVAALVRREGRIMICRRAEGKSNALLWEFPGGKVEKGETMQQAIERECLEELSVTLRAGELCAETVCAYPSGEIHLSLISAEIVSGSVKKLEHNDIRWITPSELSDYEFCPADKKLIESLRKG
ncbi:MAG: (deoxy)nucleoside triphosphate pyrophosphohydrolase [Eubacteriales bacterium]|nr:(deoxy)nucleoside triphosphate pyrophosphohydrolase [Eubacteriales bacterium]MDD3880899.1 (deoxy)nucleoside triphosphate pyrophosphohydrolase [Eubacteriales bacterium]MDD4511734.1 (deoxy)nucleoside triphosphate pyrophosphohydrolase [Eubacteriales bacterium]